VRRLIRDEFAAAFKDVDVIVGPTSPTVAFPLGAKVDDPVTMYLCDIYTIAVNLAGLPAMSLPAGFASNLPVGMQFIGNYFSEGLLLRLAHQYQQQTDWHTRIPEKYA
jgi:aspartyl-tRNA(Asn)/glutamyl-tRNA(Gln) amidotransferase subunit A